MVYVMLSRAQSLDQIVILDGLYTDQNGWKPHQSAIDEMESSKKEAINIDRFEKFDLKIMCLNVLSLQNNFVEISRKIESTKCAVACLQETWLDKTSSGDAYQIETFELSLNSQGRGRGIATYFKKPFVVTESFNQSDCQITKISSEDVDIINLYRSQECKNIEQLIRPLINLKKKTIVVGDTNINLENQRSHSFVKMMIENLRFEQLVTRPTFDRLPSFKPSLLDQVYVSPDLKELVKVEQKCLGFNDHDILIISLLSEKESRKTSSDIFEEVSD